MPAAGWSISAWATPGRRRPALVRDALKEAIGPISSYPRAAGLPALRRAIAVWVDRRYGAAIEPDTQILPTLGSKELVFSLAQAVLDPAAGKDLVLTTAPGYPIPERGARYAGGEVAPSAPDRGARLPAGPRGDRPTSSGRVPACCG